MRAAPLSAAGAVSSGPSVTLAMLALPATGALIGAAAGAAGLLCGPWLPAPMPTALAFAILLLGSRGANLGGLLASCDALLAEGTPHERRRLFKELGRGDAAIVGAAVAVPLQLAAIAALPPAHWPIALAFVGALGRWGAIVNGVRIPYVRDGSPAAGATSALRWTGLALWGVALGYGATYLAPTAAALVPLAAGVGLIGGEWARRRLGGIVVGGVYGGLAMLLEILALVGLLVLPH